ncbi:hypothetical protein [Micromonospora carbonacea]|uniref:Uncharacterized protein n=1 Tax=Micromonospora carbonacea TaxID=47853 RepID=A0A1C4WWK5_9ACTN|nr:hypothetical protein [Micromonospora carbonacea]SCF00580.1 hypothetical protein GA0070563_10481 [Micromonospora carbonacea]
MTAVRTAADVVIALGCLLYLATFLLLGALFWGASRRRPAAGAARMAVDEARQRATAAAILQPDSPLLDADQTGQLAAHEIPDVAAEAAQYLRQHTPKES